MSFPQQFFQTPQKNRMEERDVKEPNWLSKVLRLTLWRTGVRVLMAHEVPAATIPNIVKTRIAFKF